MFGSRYTSLIVEEKDVLTILTVVNSVLPIGADYRAQNCAWADEPTKWFISTRFSKKQLDKVINHIKNRGGIVEIKSSPSHYSIELYIKIEP